jgi:hypothetical protein
MKINFFSFFPLRLTTAIVLSPAEFYKSVSFYSKNTCRQFCDPDALKTRTYPSLPIVTGVVLIAAAAIIGAKRRRRLQRLFPSVAEAAESVRVQSARVQIESGPTN